MRHRPIGIGVQGLADAFIMLNMPFDSEEAQGLNKDIFETIYLCRHDGFYRPGQRKVRTKPLKDLRFAKASSSLICGELRLRAIAGTGLR